jgi:hypothetical protein
MRLANQPVLLDSATIANQENALIGLLNSYVGAFSPQSTFAGNTSDTTSDNIQAVVIPAGTFVNAGDRVSLAAYGTLAANAHNKTVGISMIQGTSTTSFSATSGSSGNWSLNMDIVYYGTTGLTQFYGGNLLLIATSKLVNGSLTLSNSSAITVQLTGQTDTAGASDIVSNFFGGNIIK